MRIFVVDNNLVEKSGHFFAVDRWLQEECRRRGIEARFYINRSAPAGIAATLTAGTIFSFRSYGGISRDKYCADIDNFLHVGPQLALELQTLTQDGLSANDMVFFPMVSQNDLYGCALWLDKIPRESRPYVCMNFMRSNFVNPQNDSLTLAGTLYRSAAKMLVQTAGKEKLIYTTQSSRMATFLHWLLSHPVTETPLLHSYNLPAAVLQNGLPKMDAGEYRISIIGSARKEKGFHLVPDLLALLSEKLATSRFFVQVTTELFAWQEEIARLRTIPRAEVHLGPLDDNAYLEKLLHTDIVLLPYHPLAYKYMNSGVFAEAVAMGKVIVAPDSSWMADHIKNKRAAGKLFHSFVPQAIAATVIEAIDEYDALHTAAARHAEDWRREQNIGRFMDELLVLARARRMPGSKDS